MASLNYREKSKFEETFGMGSGYVLDFSNASFARFVGDVVNIGIYSGAGYEEYCSKANKLRQIWDNENDLVVGNLLNALLDYYEDYKQRIDDFTDDDKREIAKLRIVTARLLGNAVKLDIPVEKKDDTLRTLHEDINNALARNKPTLVLDRLHTFATKLLRQICTDNGITVVDDKGRNLPLQSLAGMLKKHYEQNNVFDSDFTPLAVQNNIALFDRFNAIRNDQSYAHDNEVLSNMEAEFVVRTMINTITFIDTIERYRKAPKLASQPEKFDWDSDELPF